MTRIEAGLPLINVEFSSSRYAFTDHDRVTPKELGLRLDAQGHRRRRPAVRRTPRDPPRARREDLALVDRRALPRLGRLRPGLRRGRPDPAQGRDRRRGRVHALRRRGRAGRLHHEPDVLPGPAAAHRDRAGPPRPRDGRDPRRLRADHQPRVQDGRGRGDPAAVLQPTDERRPDMAARQAARERAGPTTRSSSAAGTTAWSTAPTSPRPASRCSSSSAATFVGGAAITEELRPGFHFTSFSYALSLLRPDIVQELDLVKHGFMPILMPSSFAPMENGDYLLLTQDRDENIKEIMRHSPHDADAMDRYEYDMERVCQLVKPLFDTAPPNIFGKSPEDLADIAELVKHLGGADQKVVHDLVRLLTGSAADFLDDYFESDVLKGYLASSGIIGTKVGPMSQGSGLVLLFHSLGEHDGHLRRLVVPQGRQRRLHPAARPGGRVVRRRDHAQRPGRPRASPRTAGPSASPSRTAPSSPRAPWSVRSTPGVPSPSWSSRASCPTTSSRTSTGCGSRARRRRSTSRSTVPRATRRWATAPTSTSASSTSGRRWSTSSGPSTTRSTAGTASVPTSTARSSRSSTPTWRRPASTSCRASCSTRRTTSRAATGTPSARSSPTPCRRPSSRSSPASATWCCSARSRRRSTSSAPSASPRATSSPGSSSPRRCTSSVPRPGWSQYRTPIDGYYQCGSGTHPGGCVMGAPGKLASQQILKDRQGRAGEKSVG